MIKIVCKWLKNFTARSANILRNFMQNESGVSLIELLIVLAVGGLIVAYVLQYGMSIVSDARFNASIQNACRLIASEYSDAEIQNICKNDSNIELSQDINGYKYIIISNNGRPFSKDEINKILKKIKNSDDVVLINSNKNAITEKPNDKEYYYVGILISKNL